MPATPRPDCQPTSPATYEKRTLTAAPASTCVAADGQQMSFAARKQLQDKAQSLLRGLEHVQNCRAGDACGSALCHSTKRLLRTYATHECPRRATEAAAGAADCRVCRLWQFLLAERTRKSGERAAAAADMAPPVVRPVCGLSALARRLSTRPAPAAIRRRVLVAAREAATSRRI